MKFRLLAKTIEQRKVLRESLLQRHKRSECFYQGNNRMTRVNFEPQLYRLRGYHYR